MNVMLPPEHQPFTEREACDKIDKLIQFLLHTHEKDIESFESYKQIESLPWQTTDMNTSMLYDDISQISTAMNTLKYAIQEVDTKAEYVHNLETKIVNLEYDVRELQSQLKAQQEQIGVLVEQLKKESKNTDNKKESDK